MIALCVTALFLCMVLATVGLMLLEESRNASSEEAGKAAVVLAALCGIIVFVVMVDQFVPDDEPKTVVTPAAQVEADP